MGKEHKMQRKHNADCLYKMRNTKTGRENFGRIRESIPNLLRTRQFYQCRQPSFISAVYTLYRDPLPDSYLLHCVWGG